MRNEYHHPMSSLLSPLYRKLGPEGLRNLPKVTLLESSRANLYSQRDNHSFWGYETSCIQTQGDITLAQLTSSSHTPHCDSLLEGVGRQTAPVGEQVNEEGKITLTVEILSGPELTSSSGNTRRKFEFNQGGRPSTGSNTVIPVDLEA